MGFHRYGHWKIAGEQYSNVTVTYGDGHTPRWDAPATDAEAPVIEPDRSAWSVEVPAVLWLLDHIERGNVTPAQARAGLVKATAFKSDCCADCDEIFDRWPKILADQHATFARHLQWYASLTPESHPFTLNATCTKIHTWDCSSVSHGSTPAPVIEDRHRYATRYHSDEWEDYRHRDCKRITAQEATEWAATFKRRKPPRCKVCAPVLPGAWASESSDVPSTH